LIDDDRIDAACSTPARKAAACGVFALAAASNMRLIVKPVLDVMVTVEPAPPEPLWATAAWASYDSAGMVEVGEIRGVKDGRCAAGLKWLSKASCRSETKRDFFA